MTNLPFASDSFACAYATESLEHAVDIEGAVAEICRVLKPGGRIVIIDKNIEQWGRLKTPEWEQWFGRKQLEKMLARHCRARLQPADFLLGGCRTGRSFSSLAGGEMSRRGSEKVGAFYSSGYPVSKTS